MFHHFVKSVTLDIVRVIEIFHRDELLKSGPGEFRLFDKVGLGTHEVDGRWRDGGNG